MKTLFEILQNKYNTNLVKQKDTKQRWTHMCAFANKCSINILGKEDTNFFQLEIIENSLQVKAKFEEIFFDMYVNMHDYWYDLTYQERKKQMNLEINKLKTKLSCFQVEGQEIYMPCFDAKFNHLYTDEIVLLDLKQYHTFIRTFASLIQYDVYGVEPFLHGFSSARVLAFDTQGFVLYHEAVNRLYLYQDKTFVKALSLHPKRVPDDLHSIVSLANDLLQEDEDGLIEQLEHSNLVSKRMNKKIIKYKHRKAKQLKKKQMKEAEKTK